MNLAGRNILRSFSIIGLVMVWTSEMPLAGRISFTLCIALEPTLALIGYLRKRPST